MERPTEKLLNRNDLAERWGTSVRTIDRKRKDGLIKWIDLAGGRGNRPTVRFKLADIEEYEQQMTLYPKVDKGNKPYGQVNMFLQ